MVKRPLFTNAGFDILLNTAHRILYGFLKYAFDTFIATDRGKQRHSLGSRQRELIPYPAIGLLPDREPPVLPGMSDSR